MSFHQDSICTEIIPITDLKSADFDGYVIVTDTLNKLAPSLSYLKTTLANQESIDDDFLNQVTVVKCQESSKAIIWSPTGPLNRDYDDVRRFYDAGLAGIKRALKVGLQKPIFIRPIDDSFPLAGRVAALGALQASYVPLEIRQDCPSKERKLDKISIWCDDLKRVTLGCNILRCLESARSVARDIGGSDPERMAAPMVECYINTLFSNSTCIKLKCISDENELKNNYPLLAAVNRAARRIERHQGRVIWLEYDGGDVDTTLFIVGKGITYDTGGADIKTGGAMAGMHRDKCGAAALAGFFKLLDMFKPKGLKVIGAMCMVRNSCGADSYVSDEIITARSGKRVRVKNTDAEGRMVMADVLCECKERALHEKNPQLFTWATLTGHVIRAYGPNYFALISNGPARAENIDKKLQCVGEECSDPAEISTLRRDDFNFHKAESEYEDVVQANCIPSTMTNRGHQGPAAFLIIASGLDKHGIDSNEPLKYTHCDVAGSSGPFPGVPTGSPILNFAHAYVINRNSQGK